MVCNVLLLFSLIQFSCTNSMRVLDAGITHTYKMGKNRKHRIRKSKENEAEESSDEGAISEYNYILYSRKSAGSYSVELLSKAILKQKLK